MKSETVSLSRAIAATIPANTGVMRACRAAMLGARVAGSGDETLGTLAAMSRSIAFASVCPNYKQQQPQSTYTVAVIARLLNGGYPIKAYCAPCEQVWPIDSQKRVELMEAVSLGSAGRLSAQ